MAELRDYYEVLGAAKTSSADEIKSKYKKLVMQYHPDKFRDAPKAEKEDAEQKFLLIKDAYETLSDPKKRGVYDQYGHKGLENVKNGAGASSGQSYTEAAGLNINKPRTTMSESDVFSFFDKRAETHGNTGGDKVESVNRNSAREERLKRRNGGGENTTTNINNTDSQPTKQETAQSINNTFKDVSEKIVSAAEKVGTVSVPLDTLEKFRENLNDLLKAIDTAIAVQKNKGPGFNA